MVVNQLQEVLNSNGEPIHGPRRLEPFSQVRKKILNPVLYFMKHHSTGSMLGSGDRRRTACSTAYSCGQTSCCLMHKLRPVFIREKG
jgi:hypothetical protein